MKHLIDILDLSTEEIDELIVTANDIAANPDKYATKLTGKASYRMGLSRTGRAV